MGSTWGSTFGIQRVISCSLIFELVPLGHERSHVRNEVSHFDTLAFADLVQLVVELVIHRSGTHKLALLSSGLP